MSPSPLDDSPSVSQVGLALSSLAFAVVFGTALMALGLWGVLTIQLTRPTAAGTFGPAGMLLVVVTIGGPLVASLAAYALMAPIRSYYRRGGLAIVAGFATVALTLITTMPLNNFAGRSGLLGLAGAGALLCLVMSWLARRSAAAG
jgi:predicted Co/Zn/Cd cation transporter (cation efflux family)